MAVKVFGVGLNKTGTTSLNACGARLGYRCKSCDRGLLRDVRRGDLTRAFAVAERFDLFEDWPWPLIFRELDERFPGSRFILTVRRDARTWLRSLKKHSLGTHPTRHCRKLAYGHHYPFGREREHLDFYERHNDAVRRHFADRPEDLLEVCWERGDGWAELCGFLGHEPPDAPFPHRNRGVDRRTSRPRRALNGILRRVRD